MMNQRLQLVPSWGDGLASSDSSMMVKAAVRCGNRDLGQDQRVMTAVPNGTAA
jgi:hypothetical protein